MRSGRLRHQLKLQQQSTTNNGGQLEQTWTTFAERRGSIEPLNGREYMQRSGEQAEVTTRIRLRYDSVVAVIAPKDRILHGTVTYDVQSVIDPRERNRELVLMCTRAP